jgi:hypothetical protein
MLLLAAAASTFVVDGVKMSGAIPRGYCAPTGELAERVFKYNKGDPKNDTHAIFIKCDELGDVFSHFILVKSPYATHGMTISRPQFLSEMRDLADDEDFFSSKNAKNIEQQVEAKVSEVRGKQVDVNIASMQPLGRDDTCAYMGMIVTYDTAEKKGDVQYAGSCLTSVGGKIVVIHSYGKPKLGDKMSELLLRSRDFARSLMKQ